MKVLLDKDERRVIRKIAKMQILGLRKILNEDTTEDIPLWRAEKGVSKEELDLELNIDIALYESLIIKPSDFIHLKEDDMSIVKHILHRYINKPEMHKAKCSIWRKMMHLDTPYFQNLN